MLSYITRTKSIPFNFTTFTSDYSDYVSVYLNMVVFRLEERVYLIIGLFKGVIITISFVIIMLLFSTINRNILSIVYSSLKVLILIDKIQVARLVGFNGRSSRDTVDKE